MWEIPPPEGLVPGSREYGGTDWAAIGSRLPTPERTDFSGSAALDFELAPGQEKVVRFVLAWYQPILYWGKEGTFYQMYASRFNNPTEVAQMLAREHDSLLRRILAWQEEIYSDEKLPPWLGDILINSLATIAGRPPTGYGKGALNDLAPVGTSGLSKVRAALLK